MDDDDDGDDDDGNGVMNVQPTTEAGNGDVVVQGGVWWGLHTRDRGGETGVRLFCFMYS